MNDWNFHDQAAGLIPFDLRGYKGNVAVYYGINEDPIRAGVDSIPGLSSVVDLTHYGMIIFPTCKNNILAGSSTAHNAVAWKKLLNTACSKCLE